MIIDLKSGLRRALLVSLLFTGATLLLTQCGKAEKPNEDGQNALRLVIEQNRARSLEINLFLMEQLRLCQSRTALQLPPLQVLPLDDLPE